MTQDAASRAITKIQAEYGGIFGFDKEKRAYLEQCVRAEYAELVRASFALLAELPMGLSQLVTQRKDSLLKALQDVAGV